MCMTRGNWRRSGGKKGNRLRGKKIEGMLGWGGGRDRNVKMLGRDITLEQAQEGVGDGM